MDKFGMYFLILVLLIGLNIFWGIESFLICIYLKDLIYLGGGIANFIIAGITFFRLKKYFM